MLIDPSGAEVMWDHELFTFVGFYQGNRVGTYGGDIVTVAELEAALGVSLSAETGAELQAAMLANPYVVPERLIGKNEFMDLFRPADLVAIYTMARSTVPEEQALSIQVQIQLDRLSLAGDMIDLVNPTTLAGLTQMEQYGLITAGDAQRISSGIPWQP